MFYFSKVDRDVEVHASKSTNKIPKKRTEALKVLGRIVVAFVIEHLFRQILIILCIPQEQLINKYNVLTPVSSSTIKVLTYTPILTSTFPGMCHQTCKGLVI